MFMPIALFMKTILDEISEVIATPSGMMRK
jgi:hypothetical protein